MENIIGEIASGSGGVLAGGGIVWWLIGNKLKEIAKDVHSLKELAVNDKLQDERIREMDEKIKSHHRKIGEQDVKTTTIEIKMATIESKLDNILEILRDKR